MSVLKIEDVSKCLILIFVSYFEVLRTFIIERVILSDLNSKFMHFPLSQSTDVLVSNI